MIYIVNGLSNEAEALVYGVPTDVFDVMPTLKSHGLYILRPPSPYPLRHYKRMALREGKSSC